jgi:anti-sigma-K factor RskA
MIDERQEELAALYSLDLLEKGECRAFESKLAQDAELSALVRELREAGAAIAHTAPALTPPPALRARVLASITAPAAAGAPLAQVIRPPFAIFRTVLPWAVAACFAFCAAWVGQLYLSSESSVAQLQNSQAMTETSLKSVQVELATERLLARRQVSDIEKQLLAARADVGQRDTRLAALTQRIGDLDGNRTDLGRQLAAAQQRVADLTVRLKTEGDLANLKITALASLLKNSPEAVAVAVWNPEKQEGVLQVEKLPALASDKDYQLWVVDPQYADPVDGGTFTVDAASGSRRIQFKSKQPIKNIAAYAITQETKGGVVKSAGPFLLLGK